MHFYETDADNYILYPGLTKLATILGHEFSAKVVGIGKVDEVSRQRQEHFEAGQGYYEVPVDD